MKSILLSWKQKKLSSTHETQTKFRNAKTNLDASDVEDKVDKVDMVDWPLPREGPRTEEQVNVLLAVKDEFANSSSSLVRDEGFLDLCSEKILRVDNWKKCIP